MKLYLTLIFILFGLLITNCSSPSGSGGPTIIPPDDFELLATTEGDTYTISIYANEELTLGFYEVLFLVQDSRSGELVPNADIAISPIFIESSSESTMPFTNPVPLTESPGFYTSNLYFNKGNSSLGNWVIDVQISLNGATTETERLENFDVKFRNGSLIASVTDSEGKEYFVSVVKSKFPQKTGAGVLEKTAFEFSLHEKLPDGSYTLPEEQFQFVSVNCLGFVEGSVDAYCMVRPTDPRFPFSSTTGHYEGFIRYNAGGLGDLQHDLKFEMQRGGNITLDFDITVISTRSD